MRIEKVVIENINSLSGRFEIDFANPGYADGLFAIVGPSGSGKTTVLDAISLALYGKTPRIGRISESQDEIMSRGSSMCRTEVVFGAHRKRYKATFAHKRTKKAKNPFGQVQREVMEYAEDGTWRIIAAKIRDADEKMARITGLDYDQFTRSIMLAQFKFAEFLKADANARADILEQITDMDIYRDISVAVFERAKDEREILSAINIEMGAVAVLDDDQKKALEAQLLRLDSDIAAHTELHRQLRACCDLIKAAAENERALGEYRQRKPHIDAALADAKKQFDAAAKTHADETKAQTDLLATLKKVRALDGDIANRDRDIARLNRETADDNKEIMLYKSAILALFKKHMPEADDARLKSLYEAQDITDTIRGDAKAALERAQNEQRAVAKRIDETLHKQDAPHWQRMADRLKELLPLREAQKAAAEAQSRRKQAAAQLDKLAVQDKALAEKAAKAEERLAAAKLDARFHAQRGSLEDGKPCPLCGAVHHPKADVPYDAGTLTAAEADMDAVQSTKRALDKQIIAARSDLAAHDKNIARYGQDVQRHEAALAVLGGTDDGAAIGAIRAQVDDVDRILRAYPGLLNDKAAAAEAVGRLTARLGDVDKDVHSIDGDKRRIHEIEEKIGEREKQLVDTQKLRGEAVAKRRAMFGGKNADAEETAAAKRVDDARKAVETRRGDMDKAKTQADRNAQDIARTQKAIAQTTQTLNAAYADAVDTAANVCRETADTDADIQRALGDVCAETARFGDDAADSADALTSAAEASRVLLDIEKNAKGATGEALRRDADNIKKRQELEKKAKKQQRITDKWDRLNALIGSRDGIKFSRMAQGITFEVLLQYANDSLSKMSDRYILVRDTSRRDKPLEISVVDTYQAGDMRPVSNLSGGESFVVSMALALGLSEMSSNKTRIDSLFIDEGFASLDETYLEAAMQTLSSLGNRDGKLVGVISHVDAIKERIAAKIEVTKLSGGRSTLDGPGVSVVGVE